MDKKDNVLETEITSQKWIPIQVWFSYQFQTKKIKPQVQIEVILPCKFYSILTNVRTACIRSVNKKRVGEN